MKPSHSSLSEKCALTMIGHSAMFLFLGICTFGIEDQGHEASSMLQASCLKDSAEGAQQLLVHGHSVGDSAEVAQQLLDKHPHRRRRQDHTKNMQHGKNVPNVVEQSVPEVESVPVDEHTPRLVFSHFAKCGGTFSKKVVKKAVPSVRLNQEGKPLQEESVRPGRATFTIALMRNPFNYLVSLWTMFADGRGAFVHSLDKSTQNHFKRRTSDSRSFLREKSGTLLGNSDADRNSFGEWVRHFGTKNMGLVTSRFSAKYLESNVNPLKTTPGQGNRDELVVKKLHQFNKDDIADCWAYTENLVVDLRNCLQRFQSIGGHVDWQAFNKSINLADHNTYPHVSCSKMFSDSQLRDYVATNEQLLSKTFGYALGCA